MSEVNEGCSVSPFHTYFGPYLISALPLSSSWDLYELIFFSRIPRPTHNTDSSNGAKHCSPSGTPFFRRSGAAAQTRADKLTKQAWRTIYCTKVHATTTSPQTHTCQITQIYFHHNSVKLSVGKLSSYCWCWQEKSRRLFSIFFPYTMFQIHVSIIIVITPTMIIIFSITALVISSQKNVVLLQQSYHWVNSQFLK